MAPGVVVSICYIMATGLTSLAFIIERRGWLFKKKSSNSFNQLIIYL